MSCHHFLLNVPGGASSHVCAAFLIVTVPVFLIVVVSLCRCAAMLRCSFSLVWVLVILSFDVSLIPALMPLVLISNELKLRVNDITHPHQWLFSQLVGFLCCLLLLHPICLTNFPKRANLKFSVQFCTALQQFSCVCLLLSVGVILSFFTFPSKKKGRKRSKITWTHHKKNMALSLFSSHRLFAPKLNDWLLIANLLCNKGVPFPSLLPQSSRGNLGQAEWTNFVKPINFVVNHSVRWPLQQHNVCGHSKNKKKIVWLVHKRQTH